MYDDRDGDTLTTLSAPLIKTCDSEKPIMTFFLMPVSGTVPTSQHGQPAIGFEIIGYVRLDALSRDLQAAVRKELHTRPPTAPLGTRTGDAG